VGESMIIFLSISFVYCIACIIFVYRFYNNHFFYHFFILCTVNPIYFILSQIFDITYIEYISLPTLLLIWSFPLLEIYHKSLISVPIILLSLILNNEKLLITLLVLEISFTVIIIEYISFLHASIKKSRTINLSMIIFCLEWVLNAIITFLYLDRYELLLRYSYYLPVLYIIILTFLGIVGPRKIAHLPTSSFKYNTKKIQNQNDIKTRLFIPNQPKALHDLNERETEILKLIGIGMTSKEIAERLFLSKKTIDYYRSNIHRKLGKFSRTEISKLFEEQTHDYKV
jgi:DNA-binding CsgD family transcriptional regulator